MLFRYWLIIFILGIGWGTSFLFNELLLLEMGPISVSMGRVFLGAVGCWFWAVLRGKPLWQHPRVIVGLMSLGTIFFAIPFALFPIGQQNISGGLAGIINATTPMMVIIVSHFWPGGERATVLKSLGVAVGFIGIVVLILPVMAQGVSAELWAILITLCAPICYGFATNFVRYFKEVEPTVIATWTLTGATVFITPIAIGVEGVPQITMGQTWFSLGMIGFVMTSASFIVLYWLLPKVGPTTTSTVTFITPISALIAGVLILEEVILSEHLMGMAIIFLGLLLIDQRLFRSKRAKVNEEQRQK